MPRGPAFQPSGGYPSPARGQARPLHYRERALHRPGRPHAQCRSGGPEQAADAARVLSVYISASRRPLYSGSHPRPRPRDISADKPHPGTTALHLPTKAERRRPRRYTWPTGRREDAGAGGDAIEMDGAGVAFSEATAVFEAVEAEIVAQHEEQRRLGRDTQRMHPAVDAEPQHGPLQAGTPRFSF